jgi:hypothetical protein
MRDATTALSPAFDKARSLSQVLMVFFVAAFWLNLAWMLAAAALPIWPEAARFTFDGSLVDVAGQPMPVRLNGVVAIVIRILPALVLLHHAAALFRGFAKGDVFTAAAIARIRAIGAWIIVWAFTPAAAHIVLAHNGHGLHFELPFLAFGGATFVAAHVMGEARRIADENASIL